MRVLHVLTEPRGGGGKYAVTLARASVARGDEVVFASPRPLAVGLPEIPLRVGSISRLRQECGRADLVHLHGVRAGLVGLLCRRQRVLLTTGGLHALRAAHGVWRGPIGLATRKLLRGADAIICVSEAEAEDIRKLDGSLAPRTVVVLNGVPPALVPTQQERDDARVRLGIPLDWRVILFVGSLIFQKHPELAIEAVAIARRSVPELVLLVAGEGPLRATLEPLAGEGIRLLGNRDDVEVLLAACDVVLNTSRWEGLSLALLEALWRGRPLVVTDAPGNAEAAGAAGLLVTQEPQDVAAALLRLLKNDELHAAMSAEARRRAEALFREDVMIGKTLAVYDELLAAKL